MNVYKSFRDEQILSSNEISKTLKWNYSVCTEVGPKF